MPDRTRSALPSHLVAIPPWVLAMPLAACVEWYAAHATEAQYRDFVAGVNAAANPRDGAQQGRLM